MSIVEKFYFEGESVRASHLKSKGKYFLLKIKKKRK